MTDTEKKPRAMSPRGFLHKLSSAKSAIGFIEAHRAYLTTGELSSITSPIVAMVDAKQVMPTPALAEIQGVVFAHVMAADLRKAEASLIPKEAKEPKAHVAMILDELGRVQYRTTESGEVKELVKDFDLPQEAERWVDRMLFDGAPDWHGEITWTKCPEKLQDFKVRLIDRNTSIERILRKAPGPVMHHTKVGSGGGLGFGVKVKQSTCKFSRG